MVHLVGGARQRRCGSFTRPYRTAHDPRADRRGTETRTRVEAEYAVALSLETHLERTAVPSTSLDRQRWQRLCVIGGGQFRLTAERTAGVYRARKRHLRFPPKGQKDLPPKDITQRELYVRFVTKRDFSSSYCWFLHRGWLAVRPKTRKYSKQSGQGGSGQPCRTLRLSTESRRGAARRQQFVGYKWLGHPPTQLFKRTAPYTLVEIF